jgi:hypothetical protein
MDAYAMMVLSTLSYYNFHKSPLMMKTIIRRRKGIEKVDYEENVDRQSVHVADESFSGAADPDDDLEDQTIVTGFTVLTAPTKNVRHHRHRRRQRRHINNKYRKYWQTRLSSIFQNGNPVSWASTVALHRITNNNNNNNNNDTTERRFTFQYWLFDWYESGVAKLNFHDTDVLIATRDNDGSLVLAFGGTSSAADALTNLQTFEPANHSNFYHGGEMADTTPQLHQPHPLQPRWSSWHRRLWKQTNNDNADFNDMHHHSNNYTIQGSLHRGFLNAYSRVNRGSALRLCCPGPSRPRRHHRIHPPPFHMNHDKRSQPVSYLETTQLHKLFWNCTYETHNHYHDYHHDDQNEKMNGHTNKEDVDAKTKTPTTVSPTKNLQEDNNDATTTTTTAKPPSVQRRRKGPGCFSKGTNLSSILVDLAATALREGKTVHLTGHSLGCVCDDLVA